MFDKRLMKMCPESKKYIAGNILLQFLELCCNIAMILMIAFSVQNLYNKIWGLTDLIVPAVIIAVTVIVRFFTTKYAVRMSYLASRTVKRVIREKIYTKLLRLGTLKEESVGKTVVLVSHRRSTVRIADEVIEMENGRIS